MGEFIKWYSFKVCSHGGFQGIIANDPEIRFSLCLTLNLQKQEHRARK